MCNRAELITKHLKLISIYQIQSKNNSKMAQSKIRTNFHSSSEALINKQINMELHASYVYMSMVSHMDI